MLLAARVSEGRSGAESPSPDGALFPGLKAGASTVILLRRIGDDSSDRKWVVESVGVSMLFAKRETVWDLTHSSQDRA
jgi:hypothetical protein